MGRVLRPPGALADTVAGWWNRDNSTEADAVAAHRDRIRAVGSIKWRSTTPFRAAADATIAVCPAGAAGDAGIDLVLRADDILDAWGGLEA